MEFQDSTVGTVGTSVFDDDSDCPRRSIALIKELGRGSVLPRTQDIYLCDHQNGVCSSILLQSGHGALRERISSTTTIGFLTPPNKILECWREYLFSSSF